MSLPSRERGLKLLITLSLTMTEIVAPFAGAWIEIFDACIISLNLVSRSLRGSVD